MSPEKFGVIIGGLMACTGLRLSIDDIEIWRRYLEDIPDDVLKAAFDRACSECKAFPSVALIREYATDQIEPNEPHAIAWESVRLLIRKYGYYEKPEAKKRIPDLVWTAIGGDPGWYDLCKMDNPGIMFSQFRSRYEELKQRERKRLALPNRKHAARLSAAG